MAVIEQGLRITYPEGLGTICLGQGTLATVCSVVTLEDASLGYPLIPHHDSVSSQFAAYLINIFLYCCGIGEKLVVNPGLLHCSLDIIAEPQVVDDGLEG